MLQYALGLGEGVSDISLLNHISITDGQLGSVYSSL